MAGKLYPLGFVDVLSLRLGFCKAVPGVKGQRLPVHGRLGKHVQRRVCRVCNDFLEVCLAKCGL
jgi:hypothetical protein